MDLGWRGTSLWKGGTRYISKVATDLPCWVFYLRKFILQLYYLFCNCFNSVFCNCIILQLYYLFCNCFNSVFCNCIICNCIIYFAIVLILYFRYIYTLQGVDPIHAIFLIHCEMLYTININGLY